MIKFLFRLAILAVAAFIAIYIFQDPQGKHQMEVFVHRSLTALEQKMSQWGQPGTSTACPCRDYLYGKWRTRTITCPPGTTCTPGANCAQCCN